MNYDLTIYFFARCCQLLSMTLNSVGIENVCLHGFMRQRERVAALNRFKSNHVRTLIATDVASRGLDIPNVQLVVNHRLPKQPKEYIHRVGRTARAGRQGLAISIFRFPRDLEFLSDIETAINTKLNEHPIDQRMVERIFMQVNVSKRECEMTLDNKDFDDRAHNYRRKKWIENGQDPDEMENKWNQEQKNKKKLRKKAEQEYLARKKLKKDSSADERFSNIDPKQFVSKKKAPATETKPKVGASISAQKKLAVGKSRLLMSAKSKQIAKPKRKHWAMKLYRFLLEIK